MFHERRDAPTPGCVFAGEPIGILPWLGGMLTIRSSRLLGDGGGNGLTLVGGAHRIGNITIAAHARCINAFAAAFEVAASALSGSDTGNGAAVIDDAQVSANV